jgi:uncharacterized protein YegL
MVGGTALPRIQLQSSLTKMKVMAGKPFSQKGSLQVSVRGTASLLPASLVLVMDCSGSMKGKPMELLNNAIDSIAQKLRNQDKLSIVAFGSEAEIIVQEYSKTRLIDEGIPQLYNMGGTNFKAGLETTLDMLAQSMTTKRLDGPSVHTLAKTILFMSDGRPDWGRPYADFVFEFPKVGYSFHTLGVGDGVNPETLLKMAENAAGIYLHAKNPSELENQLDEMLRISQGLVYAIPKIEFDVFPGTTLSDLKLIAPARQLQETANVGSHEIILPDIDASSMFEIGFDVSVDNSGAIGQKQDLVEWRMAGAAPEMTRVFWVDRNESITAVINPRPITASLIHEGVEHLKEGRTKQAKEVQTTLVKMGADGNKFAQTGATTMTRIMRDGGKGSLQVEISKTKMKKGDGTIGD